MRLQYSPSTKGVTKIESLIKRSFGKTKTKLRVKLRKLNQNLNSKNRNKFRTRKLEIKLKTGIEIRNRKIETREFKFNLKGLQESR